MSSLKWVLLRHNPISDCAVCSVYAIRINVRQSSGQPLFLFNFQWATVVVVGPSLALAMGSRCASRLPQSSESLNGIVSHNRAHWSENKSELITCWVSWRIADCATLVRVYMADGVGLGWEQASISAGGLPPFFYCIFNYTFVLRFGRLCEWQTSWKPNIFFIHGHDRHWMRVGIDQRHIFAQTAGGGGGGGMLYICSKRMSPHIACTKLSVYYFRFFLSLFCILVYVFVFCYVCVAEFHVLSEHCQRAMVWEGECECSLHWL